MVKPFWGKNVLCIISGASRGFGKATAIEFAKRFIEIYSLNQKKYVTLNTQFQLSFILMARDENALKDTQSQLTSLNEQIKVIAMIIGSCEDIATIQMLDSQFKHIEKDFDQVILIHNSGSLGDPNKTVKDYSLRDYNFLNQYFQANLISMILITSSFLKWFELIENKVVINISSLMALSAIKGLSMYAIGKAARDSYLRSLILEYPSILGINYAPGPLQTSMADCLKKEGFFQEFFNEPKNILQPNISARRLLSLLEAQNFENGSHVDYFDPI